MRDVGANQVIDQTRVFGNSLRFFHEFETPIVAAGQNARWRSMICRAVSRATGAGGVPGPVQLNLSLADPLLPDSADPLVDAADWPEPLQGRGAAWTVVDASAGRPAGVIPPPEPGERALILADLTHPDAAGLAAAGHLVLSESGGAGGACVLDAGLHLLAQREFGKRNRPDRVIVLGRPTLNREITALLVDPAVHVDMVAPAVGWRGVAGNVRRVAASLGIAEPVVPTEWAQEWRSANTAAAAAVASVIEAQDLSASPALAREVTAGAAGLLVLGSSQPVRDIGIASRPRDGLRILANRGAAGIDGTVSTAVGAALAHGPAVAYLGDLTLLHDFTGLVIGPQEPRPDLTIVVSNNDGGAIFGTLEPGKPLYGNAFERVFGTPHGADLGALVSGAGHPHTVVRTRTEFAQAMSEVGGIRVIEVRTARDTLPALLAELHSAVAAALR